MAGCLAGFLVVVVDCGCLEIEGVVGIGTGTSGSGSGVIVVKWGFVVVFQGLSLS